MSDPNAGASPESIQNKLDGVENGIALSYRKVALLEPSKIFGLATSYPYSEGPNTSSSQLDQQTTQAKILTRTYVASDGKTYDLFDAVMTILESVVRQ
jgi:hypothetical protein